MIMTMTIINRCYFRCCLLLLLGIITSSQAQATTQQTPKIVPASCSLCHDHAKIAYPNKTALLPKEFDLLTSISSLPATLPSATTTSHSNNYEYTCEQIAAFIPTIISDEFSIECQLMQDMMGPRCGCPPTIIQEQNQQRRQQQQQQQPLLSLSACRLCSQPIRRPHRELPFLEQFFEGYIPTCQALEAYLLSQTTQDEVFCRVSQEFLSTYCGCDDCGPQDCAEPFIDDSSSESGEQRNSNNSINTISEQQQQQQQPCSLCISGTPILDKDINVTGLPFSNCLQLESAISTLFQNGTKKCDSLRNIGTICGCQLPLNANPCSLCPDGRPIGTPTKPLNFLEDIFGGIPPTCELYEAYAMSFPSDSTKCHTLQLTSSLCGCPPLPSHCDLCGHDDMPESYKNKTIQTTYLKHIGFENAPFPVTCELAEAIKYQLPPNHKNCVLMEAGSFVCGCNGGEFNYARTGQSKPKKIILVWASRSSGLLSLTGAALIIADIFRDTNKQRKLYSHLMVGMSLFDFISSVAWALASIPMDSNDIWPFYGEAGNRTTCKLQGFLIQLSSVSIFYNISLNIYYYLVICKGWRDTKLKKIRIWLHATPIVVGLTLSLIGIPQYHGLVTMCHLPPPPFAENMVAVIALVLVPTYTVLVFVTISSVLIYLKVRNQSKKSFRWNFASREARMPRSAENTSDRGGAESIDRFSFSHSANNGAGGGRHSCTAVSTGGTTGSRRYTIGGGSAIGPNGRRHSGGSSRMMERRVSLKTLRLRNRSIVEREVTWQAILYVSSFYTCWIFATIGYYKAANEGYSYGFHLLQAILGPLQGFLNSIVYFRPRIARSLRRRRKAAEKQRNRATPTMEEVAETANLIQRCHSWLPFGICGATKTGDDQKKINPEHQARFVLEPSALVAESNDEFLQVVEAHLDEFMANDPDSQTRSVITMTEAAQIVAEAFDGDNEEEEKEEEAHVCRSLEKRY